MQWPVWILCCSMTHSTQLLLAMSLISITLALPTWPGKFFSSCAILAHSMREMYFIEFFFISPFPLYLPRSNDGSVLVVSSSDCYCSFITFEKGELGVPMDPGIMVPSRTSSRDSTPGRSTPGRATPRPQQSLASKNQSSPAGRAMLSGKGESPAVDGSDRQEIGMVTPTSNSEATHMEVGSSNGITVNSSKEQCDSEKLTGGSRTNQAPPRRVDFITLSSYRKVKVDPPQLAAASTTSSDNENSQTISSKKESEADTVASPPQPNVDGENTSCKPQLRRVNFVTLSSYKKLNPSQDPTQPSTANL